MSSASVKVLPDLVVKVLVGWFMSEIWANREGFGRVVIGFDVVVAKRVVPGVEDVFSRLAVFPRRFQDDRHRLNVLHVVRLDKEWLLSTVEFKYRLALAGDMALSRSEKVNAVTQVVGVGDEPGEAIRVHIESLLDQGGFN